MTKQETGEPVLKCHLDIEETVKVDCENLGKMLETNAFVINDGKIVSSSVSKRKSVTPAKTSSRVDNLDNVTKKLYNLEPAGETEKPLRINLGLYQMENF